MTYVTQNQLVDRYGDLMLRQLTDRATPPAGVIDATVVTRAITDADALIDGYMAGRYRLPLADVPALLIPVASAIAIYLLHGQGSTEKIRLDYQDAIKSLYSISMGTVRLDVAGVEPTANSSSGVSQTNSPSRPLSSGTMPGLI